MLFVNVEELITVIKLRNAPRGERLVGGCKSPSKTRKVRRTYRAPIVNIAV